MNFLIDTNIVIPLEPASKRDLAINTELAAVFHQLSVKSGSQIFIHPVIKDDFRRDKLEERRKLREVLVNKYQFLQSPPSISTLDASLVGSPKIGSNSWVDNHLLAAAKGDLVDYLVTEDIGIHKKAKRLKVDSRVLLLADVIELLKDLFDKTPCPPPTVVSQFLHEINLKDPFFNSLRSDYAGFDVWFAKCKREQRQAYVVYPANSREIAAIAIFKKETHLPNGVEGKVLKICTFKVSSTHGGNKLGELLLKAIFEYVEVNSYDYTYLTTYEKQDQLINFIIDFGFGEITNNHSSSELAFSKPFHWSVNDPLIQNPFDFHVRYGPRVTSFCNNSTFVVPIQPKYHGILFPELQSQRSLFPEVKPCGNSIRKAYLSHSQTTKIKKGDNLVFYRSRDLKAVTCIGIAEDTFRSDSAIEIAKYVGNRTVYSYSVIEAMCEKRVLAVKFRLVKPLKQFINLEALRNHGIVNGQPQSITEISSNSIEWLKLQIGM